MDLVRNLNYANRCNPAWRRANNRAKRCLYRLLAREALKLLPSLLLFKIRQYQKLALTIVVVLFVKLFLAHKKGYAQADGVAYYKSRREKGGTGRIKEIKLSGGKPNLFNLSISNKPH